MTLVGVVEPMGKPGIEYSDEAENPYHGCRNLKNGVCAVGPDCWAGRRANMLAKNPAVTGYDPADPFKPTFDPRPLDRIRRRRKPTRYAMCFMGDIAFCGGKNFMEILKVARDCPQHRFYFLTKCPEAIMDHGTWPKNAWLGTSINTEKDLHRVEALTRISMVTVKWVSVEPMMGPLSLKPWLHKLKWVVIGAQTGAHPLQPDPKWVGDLIFECAEAGVPTFLKPNLNWEGNTREFPKMVCPTCRGMRVVEDKEMAAKNPLPPHMSKWTMTCPDCDGLGREKAGVWWEVA